MKRITKIYTFLLLVLSFSLINGCQAKVKTSEATTIYPNKSGMSKQVYSALGDPDGVKDNKLDLSFGQGLQVWKDEGDGKFSKYSEVYYPVYDKDNILSGILIRYELNGVADFTYLATGDLTKGLDSVMSSSDKVMIIYLENEVTLYVGKDKVCDQSTLKVEDNITYADIVETYGNEVTPDRYPLSENN